MSAIAANVQRTMQNIGPDAEGTPELTYIEYNTAMMSSAKRLLQTYVGGRKPQRVYALLVFFDTFTWYRGRHSCRGLAE